MTNRLVNIGFLLLILAVGVGYLWMSRTLTVERLGDDLRPVMFPVALGAGSVLLSLVEIVRTLRSRDPEEDESFVVPNLGRLAATIALMALHFLTWSKLGAFYAATVILFTALVLLFRGQLTAREVGGAAGLAIAFTALIWAVFQLAFGIDLG